MTVQFAGIIELIIAVFDARSSTRPNKLKFPLFLPIYIPEDFISGKCPDPVCRTCRIAQILDKQLKFPGKYNADNEAFE